MIQKLSYPKAPTPKGSFFSESESRFSNLPKKYYKNYPELEI